MKKIPFKEFADWVLAQPKDQKIDMRENASYDKCGCLLVQFGRTLGIEETFLCDWDGGATMSSDTKKDFAIKGMGFFVKECHSKNIKTFKEAQKLIQEYL